jgi:hypothetical protein
VFVYSSHGRWVSPLSCGVFLPPPLSQAFPLLVAGHVPASTEASLAKPSFIYSSGKDSLPLLFGAQGAPLSLLHVFIVLIAYYSVSLFPWVGLVFPGGYADLAQRCLWEYCVLLSSPCPHLPKQSGRGRLAAWGPLGFSVQGEVRCSVQAGGVEGSKFCHFSVALPARCVSSVSPRFHFRWHTFCFLPLAAIFRFFPPFFTVYSPVSWGLDPLNMFVTLIHAAQILCASVSFSKMERIISTLKVALRLNGLYM